jgi:hypothetical protein
VHISLALTTVLAIALTCVHLGRVAVMLTLAVLALRGSTPSERPRILETLALVFVAAQTPERNSAPHKSLVPSWDNPSFNDGVSNNHAVHPQIGLSAPDRAQ